VEIAPKEDELILSAGSKNLPINGCLIHPKPIIKQYDKRTKIKTK
jgi:hypothetical protein